MILTEEEAKTKWCPYVRVEYGTTSGLNRDGLGCAADTAICLASGCMAWRWLMDEPHDIECASVRTQMDPVPDLCNCDGPSTRVGFCGLAGAP